MKDLFDELDNYWANNRLIDLGVQLSLSDNVLQFTWGTTPFSTFVQMINLVDIPKRFVVFGSSIGFQCFYFRSIFSEIEIVGYDIHPSRVDFSNKILQKYNIKNCQFILDDIQNAKIESGDLIWQNNLCMDIDFLDHLNFKILSTNQNIQMVSYKPVLQDFVTGKDIFMIDHTGNFRSYSSSCHHFPTSWSREQNFFVIK